MQKHLYFICPTDHLETVIEAAFGQKIFFYTSLANSIVFDRETIGQINRLIETQKISKITFVLSGDNQLVIDAIKGDNPPNIYSLYLFFNTIGQQTQHQRKAKQLDTKLLIFSRYMNMKIKELQFVLSESIVDKITINALIYNKQNKAFVHAYPEFFKLRHFNLN